jgi:lipoprotein-releasing system permease protein
VPGRFEFFVALRYLRAKRKETAISLVTLISVGGVAAGVAALIIALAINSGFRATLQKNLLGATAHVSVVEAVPQYGIRNWREIAERLRRMKGVEKVQPSLYQALYVSGPAMGTGAVVKGIPADSEPALEALRRLKSGRFEDLREPLKPGFFPLIVGSELARQTGLKPGVEGTVVSPAGEMTPFGPWPLLRRFRCVGVFESGFYALDLGWAFTTIEAARELIQVEDVVNSIELTLEDPGRAPEVAAEAAPVLGKDLSVEPWQEQNRQLLGALKMERTVTVITIGLIQLVAALNILIALTMMVMEKRRDIAVLMSMGARAGQIRNIFLAQGLLIGMTGTVIGLAAGYTVCYFGDRQRWIQLDESIYALSFVPFQANAWDGIWVAGVAIGVSFLATLWPARNATRVAPVETLRYE